MNAQNDTRREGYVADTEYHGLLFRELSPNHIRTALLLQGYDLPDRAEGEPFRYMELGYGQGVSLNIHAAAASGEFLGTDFLPAHAQNAGSLAKAAGLDNVFPLNLSFAELDAFCAEGGVPPIDLMVMHGVWSWVSDEHRQQILNIIRRCLKPGGVVYVSYNAMPGWADFAPVREFMMLYADELAEDKDTVTQTEKALSFVRVLAGTEAKFFVGNEKKHRWLEGLTKQSTRYLAHEYMNRNWKPFYFFRVAEDMASAGCSFATSTRPIAQLDLALPQDMAAMIREELDPILRETLRDYAINQTFRTDLFVRDMRRLTPEEHFARLGRLCLTLTQPISAFNLDEEFSINTPSGAVELKKELIYPLALALAEDDYAPKTLAWLHQHPALAQMPFPILLEVVNILFCCHLLMEANPLVTPQTAAACARFNRLQCERAKIGSGSIHITSPILGSGWPVDQIDALFLLACADGKHDPAVWAEDAWSIAVSQKQEFLENGEPMPKEKVISILLEQAQIFAEHRLPYIRAMLAMPGAAG